MFAFVAQLLSGFEFPKPKLDNNPAYTAIEYGLVHWMI